jgi:hypothetical protein
MGGKSETIWRAGVQAGYSPGEFVALEILWATGTSVASLKKMTSMPPEARRIAKEILLLSLETAVRSKGGGMKQTVLPLRRSLAKSLQRAAQLAVTQIEDSPNFGGAEADGNRNLLNGFGAVVRLYEHTLVKLRPGLQHVNYSR